MSRNTDTEVTMNSFPISRPATTAADDATRLATAWTNQQAKRRRDAAIRASCGDLTTVTMVAR